MKSNWKLLEGYSKDMSEDLQLESYKEKRQRQTSGVDICECGGVFWVLGDVRKCGDCGKVDRRKG